MNKDVVFKLLLVSFITDTMFSNTVSSAKKQVLLDKAEELLFEVSRKLGRDVSREEILDAALEFIS